MILMSLFARQQWRNREQTYGRGEWGGEGECMEGVPWKLTLPCVK